MHYLLVMLRRTIVILGVRGIAPRVDGGEKYTASSIEERVAEGESTSTEATWGSIVF